MPASHSWCELRHTQRVIDASSYIFPALDCHQVDESKNSSSGLEAKTCYRGERIPAIGDGWSRNFFIALRLLSSPYAFSAGACLPCCSATLHKADVCGLGRVSVLRWIQL